MKISDEHFFVKVLPPEEVPSRGGGENEWTMRKTEFLFLEHLDWAPELIARNFCWSMLPARATKILNDLDSEELNLTETDDEESSDEPCTTRTQ